MFIFDRSFVSYSQLGEDKLVRNIIDRIRDSGGVLPSRTYVDIGAYHPTKASNTYFLYNEGWRGTVVDANPEKCLRFKKKRTRDCVVSAAIVPSKLVGVPLVLSGSGLNDASESVVAAEGQPDQDCLQTSLTLDAILKGHEDRFGAPPTLLTVDIEGLDSAVVVDSTYLTLTPIPLLLIESFLPEESKQRALFSYQETDLDKHLSAARYQLVSVVGPTLFYSHQDFWVPFGR